jgi:hypothetical protein
MARILTLLLGLLCAFGALAQPKSPPPQQGCNGRHFIQASPEYLAVNDPCLANAKPTGDARRNPIIFSVPSPGRPQPGLCLFRQALSCSASDYKRRPDTLSRVD